MPKRPLIIGLAVGGTFLWVALREVDLDGVVAALSTAHKTFAIPFLVLLTGFYILKVMRWRDLIHARYPATVSGLAGPMMIGFAANNLLPLRAGEIIRVFAAGNKFHIPKAYLAGTLIVERFFDLIAVAVITSAGLVTTYVLHMKVEESNRMYGAAALIIGILAALLFVSSRISITRLAIFLRFLPEQLMKSVEEHLARFQSGLRTVADDSRIGSVLANSILQWLMLTGCLYVSLIAFDIELSMAAPAILLGIIVMGISLPSSPGYIGTIELAFVFSLGLFDVSADIALASAIFYHVLSFASVTLVGLYCYLRGDAFARNQ